MSLDDRLTERVREILAQRRGVTEKPLMGTAAFMVNGTMCCAVGRDGLLIRVEPEARERLLDQPFVSAMKLGVRTMKGFVLVAHEGVRTRAKLAKWLERGIAARGRSPRSTAEPGKKGSSTRRRPASKDRSSRARSSAK